MESKSLILCVVFLISGILCVDWVEKDIRDFGAEGDGQSWDHLAFKSASDFFNARGGYGRLTISAGTYMIGRQTFGTGLGNAWVGDNVLVLNGVKNVIVEGVGKPLIKFIDGLHFGSFDPVTGQPYYNAGTQYQYQGNIGTFCTLQSSSNITVRNLEVDGNSRTFVVGGQWGDTGIQLAHDGFDIFDCTDILFQGVSAHHFGKDGIMAGNHNGRMALTILDSSFNHNGRQGFSWIGGTGVIVKNSEFSHQGRGGVASSPLAGVDMEGEWGMNSDGYFEGNKFIDNSGVAVVSDYSSTANMIFKNNIHWGTTSYSTWYNMPNVTSYDSEYYGTTVWGYPSSDPEQAIRYHYSYFSDPTYYDGRPSFGNWLAEHNYDVGLTFDHCTFIATNKRVMWIDNGGGPNINDYVKLTYTNIFTNISAESGITSPPTYRIINTWVKGSVFQWAYGPASRQIWPGGGATEGGGNILIFDGYDSPNQHGF